MKKLRKLIRRMFRQSKNRFEYALIYHKVSRRLGHVRAQNRQLRTDNEYLRAKTAELYKALLRGAPSIPIVAEPTPEVIDNSNGVGHSKVA